MTGLLRELCELITSAREHAAIAVNRELTLMHWNIGNTIRRNILREERAAYGEQIVATLSQQLTAEFGRGFEHKSILRMMQFAEVFPDLEIVATLSR